MVGREARDRVLEKAEALMRVLDELQGDLDNQCTVNVIQALVDLIEALYPIPPRLVRDVTNFLLSETSTLSQALSAPASSPTPTHSTSTRDHPSSSEASLNSLWHSDGPTADENDASEMAIEAGQCQGTESSSFPMPMPGSDFDTILQQLQQQPDTTSPRVYGSTHGHILDVLPLLDQGSGSIPELEATHGAGHLQDTAETLPSYRLPSSPVGSGWPIDTEDGVNATTQPRPSALDMDMDTSDLLPFLDIMDTNSKYAIPPLPTQSPDDRQTDDHSENVIAQLRPLSPPDMDMLGRFPPDIDERSWNHPPPFLPSTPPGCRWPLTDKGDESVPAQQEPLLSPALAPLDMDLDSVSDFDPGITSDNRQTGLDSSSAVTTVSPASPISPQSPVSPLSPVSSVSPVSQALENIRIAVEQGDLHRLPIDQIPSTAHFKFPWGSLNGTTVRSLFRQLSSRDSMIGNEVIDYLSRKLTSSELWIGRWSQMDQFQLCRRILFVRNEDTMWSLIDAQLEAGTITYSTCSPPESISSPDRDDIISTIDRLLGRNSRSAPAWNFQVEAIPNQSECDGLFVPWTIYLRAKGKDPLLPIPTNYRLSLVKKLVSDLKAAYSNLAALQTHPRMNRISIHAEAPLENFWINFGNNHGYGLRFWKKIQDLATIPVDRDKNMGQVRASELLQMALSIASPESLITLKNCIKQVRSQLASEGHSFSESARGLFDALRCHSTRYDLSVIGSRIGNWKLHMLKSELKDELEVQILQGQPEPSDADVRGQVQEMLKSVKKGAYWSHLVEHAGDTNPNILCLVPRAATMGPFDSKFNATSYRDLSVPDCKLLGELIEEFRPGVIASIDVDLSKVLLYVKEPLGYYPLEQLSETHIRGQKLSSAVFCEALVLKQRNPIS